MKTASTHKSKSELSLKQLLEAEKQRIRIKLIIFRGMGVTIIALSAMGYWKWKQVPTSKTEPAYEYVPLKKGDLISSVSSTGKVEARNTVEVGAEISGRILSLLADFNDPVEKGQILAHIDKTRHEAVLAEAKAKLMLFRASVAEADANRTEALRNKQRSEELAAKGLISSKELQNANTTVLRAEAAVNSAQANLAIAKANLESARNDLAKTQIISPISGVVLSRKVEVGQTINAGMETPVLFILAEDLKKMRLSSKVDEADIGKIREGQQASFTVDAYSGQTFESTVISVLNVPTEKDNVVSYEVQLTVDNQDNLLKPGMTASVEIITKKYEQVLLLPNSAFRFSPKSSGTSSFDPPGGGIPIMIGKKGKSESNDKQAMLASSQTDITFSSKSEEKLPVIYVKDSTTSNGLRQVPIQKIATDSVQTVVVSNILRIGDEVVVGYREDRP